MPYVNLPGSYVQLQDGNLSFFARDITQSVLVLGTATKGLTSEPFLMTDLGSVIKEFGATSELARTASEVRKGGATNIFVYRLPGTAPVVTGIGADVDRGTPEELGVTIRTAQESPEAAAKYGVAYRHVKNIGPADDTVASRELTAELLVVNLETSTVVWQGTALEGATVDNGEVDVQFALGDVDPGRSNWASPDYTTKEVLKFTFEGTATEPGTLSVEISGMAVSVVVADNATAADIADDFVTAFALVNGLDCFTATADTGTVTIECTGDTNADGELVYPAAHAWAGYTARPYISAPLTAGEVVGITLGNAWTTSHGRASDIGLYPQDVNKPFAPAGGGVYIPLDKIVSGATALKSYGLNAEAYNFDSRLSYATLNFNYGMVPSLATFTTGTTDANISLMKRYEKLHTAFENLDLAPFDFVVCSGVSLDAKNCADAMPSTYTFTEDAYPTPKSALDSLGYCSIVNNGDYTYTYLWSDDGETMKIASSGPVDDVTGSYTFSEVNLAHLIAKYCYENSNDYRFVHGVVGTNIPDSISTRGVRAYFGEAPTYTYDSEQNAYYVTESASNGQGLLGHRFVGGKSDFNEGVKHGGFFLTEDGTMDYSSSNLLLDDNGKKIDLGKYLSVVAIFGRMNDDINSRRPAYIANAAPIVAGMLPRTNPVDSLINIRVPGLLIDYRLETKTVDVACGLGLVVAKSEAGIPVIADSPTFASPTSDYTRLTTVRIVSKIAEELRQAARPYIGKGLSATKRAALESAIGEVLKANLAGEPVQTVTRASFKIEQTAADRVLGRMKVSVSLTPIFELRQITFSVNLSAQ